MRAFVHSVKNVNICILTTAAELPWSNGLIERHNAIVGYTVTKTMEDAGCDLKLTLSWAVTAKNSLKNVNGFSTNQIVFGGSPNYPTALNSKLPALQGKSSSEVVASNIDAMHAARPTCIQSETSDEIKRALQYQTRTSGDVCYFTGDIVYYKRENNSQWHGPGTAIGQDGKQILVKHGKVFVRVHACRITHAIDNDDNNGSNNIGDTAENAPNLSSSDSKNIDQINHLVTDSNDTGIEDNLESDVLSNLETVDKDEENINNTNNENEHNNQENTTDETQNSNLESISQLTESIEQLSLDTNVNDQIPLTRNSDKLPKPS